MLNGSNITASSTNGMVGNYALSYISQIFSAPTNIIGGTMLTSNSSGIRGLGAGVSTLGSLVGGSIGRGVYESVLRNGLSKESVGSGITSGFKNAFNFSDGKFGKLSSTGAGLGMNAAGTILAAIGGPKREYSGEKGDVTQGLDTAYDIAQTAVGFIPGVGTMVSGLMSLNKGVTGMLNKWGGGTDAMTTADAVLGSNFMGPIGSINGFFGKKSHSMGGKDFMTQNKLNNVWSGYGGTYTDYNKALAKENKKYGLISSGARKSANRLIDRANINRELLLDINNSYELGNIRGNIMAGIRGNAYQLALFGGIKPTAIGKNGMKIYLLKTLAKRKLKLGGTIEITPSVVIPWKPDEEEIKKFLKGGNLQQVPNFLTYDPETDTYTSKYLSNDKLAEDIKWYKSKESKLFRKNYILDDLDWENLDTPDGKSFRYIPKKVYDYKFRIKFPNLDFDGGLKGYHLDEDGEYEYIMTDQGPAYRTDRLAPDGLYYYVTESEDEYTRYKNGGLMNLIPEGSLHARLHHMEDAEGLTKKGIPVVDNEGNQQAEIELNEIIFRKEVTDKLEELAKDGSNKAAEEAGRLLVTEIFENTDDRTGLIKELTNEVSKALDGLKVKPINLTNLAAKEASIINPKLLTPKPVQPTQQTGTINSEDVLGWFSLAGRALLEGLKTMLEAKEAKELEKENRKLAEQLYFLELKDLEAIKTGNTNFLYLKDVADNRERALFYAEKHPESRPMLLEGGEVPSLEEFIKSKIGDLILEYVRMYKGGGEND